MTAKRFPFNSFTIKKEMKIIAQPPIAGSICSEKYDTPKNNRTKDNKIGARGGTSRKPKSRFSLIAM